MTANKQVRSELLQGALKTEYKTVYHLVKHYCRKHHLQVQSHANTLCHACSSLLAYAEFRLDRCPYGQAKPTCNKCPVHCYKPQQKQEMKTVMRYSGPRMLLSHPILAIRHLLHERRPVPKKPMANVSNRHIRKQQ